MKQKRKEEALLSGKVGFRGGMILTLLSVLGGAIGLAILGLQAKPVSAQPIPEPTPQPTLDEMRLNYTGVNDNVETLRGLYFLDTDLKEELYKVYENGSSLYVTPRNVVVNDFVADGVTINHNSNQVNGVYGHVLGGKDNKVSSDNVTIIGGNDNEIQGSNTNAVLLGGTSNKMLPGRNLELVLVGGLGNKMLTPNGLAGIIGGTGNTIFDQSSEATILGGYQSEIHGANAIVGGNKVVVGDNANNVFAFTDDRGLNIGSEGSDAFYLNVQKGLGINKGSSEGGVETSGAVGFGDIDINTDVCDPANYGVQGVWNIGGNIGCMVGCTEQGWELIDSSDECRAACNNPINSNCKDNPPDEMYGAVSGHCVGSINHYQAERCPGRSPEPYLNVMFEEALVDVGLCDRLPDNQCTYVCKSGTHLVNDTLNMQGRSSQGTGCYQDCGLPWDTSTKKKHGETVIGYDTNQEYCAYPDSDSHNPKSIWTCDKDHKAELICVDGTWYNNQTKQKDNGKHSKGECDQKGYTCDSSYNLTEYDITHGEFAENPGDVSFNHNVDRGNGSVGKRGHYKLCINFVGGGKEHNEQCNVQTPEEELGYKYEAECIDGFTEKVNGKCAYMCTDIDGNKVSHLSTTMVYRDADPDCEVTGGCEEVYFQCIDGVWHGDGKEISSLSSYAKYCSVVPVCEQGRDITDLFEQLKTVGIDSFTETSNCYLDGSLTCMNPRLRFKQCAGESHTESADYCDLAGIDCRSPLGKSKQGSNERYCIPDKITRYCLQEGKEGGDKTVYVGTSNPIVYQWDGSEWKDASSGNKGNPANPPKCTWRCEDWNKVRDGEDCIIPQTDCEGTMPSGTGVFTGAAKYFSGDTPTDWQNGYVVDGGNLKGCQWTCKGENKPNAGFTGCDPIPKCKGDAPKDATSVNGIGDSTSDVTNTLYETQEKANNNYCSYVCPSGKVAASCDSEGKCSGGCVEPSPLSCQNSKPEGNYARGSDKYYEGKTTYTKWTRVDDTVPAGDLGPCEYKCDTDNNYKRDGSKCEPLTYKCKNNAPSGNGYLLSLKDPTNASQEKIWEYSGVVQSALGPCEYTCNTADSYQRVGTGCVKPDPEPDEDEEFCGNAIKKSYKTKPTSSDGLCNPSASKTLKAGAVNTRADVYEWTCSQENGQLSKTCTAKRVACGTAHENSFSAKPTEGLCNNSSKLLSAVELKDGKYTWACTDSGVTEYGCWANYKPNVAECGTSAGGVYTDSTKPTTNYCKDPATLKSGSKDTKEAQYSWKCELGNSEDSDKTCYAIRVACGSAANAGKSFDHTPTGTDGLCNSASVLSGDVSQLTNKYTWTCGTGDAANFVSVSCEAGRKVEVECGTSEGGIYTDSDKPSNYCKTPSTLKSGSKDTKEGQYSWKCEFGGSDKTCYAKRVACGTAANAGKSFDHTPVPTDGLCNSSSVLSGDVTEWSNKYTWTCGTGDTYFVSVACEAGRDLATCGSANGKIYNTAPSDNLCGTNSVYAIGTMENGRNSYTWKCSRGSSIKECSAIRVACGPANNSSLSSQPNNIDDLCEAPSITGSNVTLNGNTYGWSCYTGSVSVPCYATYSPLAAECGDAKGKSFTGTPTTNLCKSPDSKKTGSVQLVNGKYEWTCYRGTTSNTVTCTASKLSAVCGTGTETSYTATPSITSSFCSGDALSTFDNGTMSEGTYDYSWKCKRCDGETSCTTTTCSAPRIACGDAVKHSSTTKPTTDLCNKPEYATDVSSSSSGTKWTWKCKSGNISVTCNADRTEEELCGNAKDGVYSDDNTPNASDYCKNNSELYGSLGTSSDGLYFTWTCKKSGGTRSCQAPRVACGTANGNSYENLTSSSAGLCNSNSTLDGSVSKGSTWTWKCKGTNDSTVKASCSATITATPAGCGNADGKDFKQKPTSSDGLCDSVSTYDTNKGVTEGTDSNGNPVYEWTCKRGNNTLGCSAKKVDCGSANGNSYENLTSSSAGLCNSNSTLDGSVSKGSTWTWKCKGKKDSSVKSDTCSANITATPAGCGNADRKDFKQKPTSSDGLCDSVSTYDTNKGVTEGTDSNGNPVYEWTCKRGDNTTTCSAKKVDCGTANGNSYENLTSSSAGLCNSNSKLDGSVNKGSTWTWKCKGKNDSSVKSDTCSANITPTPAGCGTAYTSGKEYAVKPTLSDGLCDSVSSLYGSVFEGTNNNWTWTCKRGDNTATCTAKMIKCGSANGGSFGYSETPSSNLCINSELYQDVELLTNKYRWKCKGEVSGNIKSDYCVAERRPDGHAKCDLREPYGCENATSIKKVDDTSKTEWQWYCKGEDDVGDGAYCHVNCNDLGENGKDLVWTDTHVGSCVKSEDGECDFKTSKCKNNGVNNDRYDEKHTDTTLGEKTWECKGLGKGKNTLCYMRWECEGNCSGNGNECGTAYQSLSLNTEDSCKAAGVYGKGNSVSGICRLRAGGNIGVGYIPSCGNLRFDLPGTCGDYPYCWYHACFNFSNPQKVCYTKVDNGSETKHSASDCDTSIKSNYNGDWCTASNSHTLSFDKNGCNSTNQITRYLASGDPLSFLSQGADCGSSQFKEWNDKADCSGTTWTSASTMPNKNLKLYACIKNDPCADYPLTSCDFPGAVHCSKCPSDSSKMKLEVCAPTYDSFAPHYDDRGVTYWIKTDGTCPVGAICAPANITWYTKNGNTCVPNEHNNKIIGCQDCYRKAYMGPECVYDASYCSTATYTLTLDPNRSGCNSATYTLNVGEQFQSKLNPPSGCSSQYWAGWYTEKNGGTKYQGGDTMPASDLTLYGHWSSPSSNGSCHTSTVGHPCIEAYYNGSPNTSWTNYVQQTSTNGWASYCNSKTSETSCIDAGATLMTQYGNAYNGWINVTKYKAISNYSTYQTTNSANVTETKYRCCEWSGPSS